MSSLGKIYDDAYAIIAGRHPHYRIWHYQWLFMRQTHIWQEKQFSALSGRILDVGCGDKPYGYMFTKNMMTEHIGLDVIDGPNVDLVVKPDEKWPIEDQSVDAIVSCQVLEHVENTGFILSEMTRVLRVGGKMVITVPFVFPEHGMPFDYRRISVTGLSALFDDKQFTVLELMRNGYAGSVIGTLLLTSIENAMNANKLTRILKGFTLPLWLPFTLLVNLVCHVIDNIDASKALYCNSCIVVKREA